ncbi:hypothetical protein CYMTET_53016 [Cymbomonas tetramitiformis]|uniref:Protein kinase domain-containing protein n=1 Tax=Cymbomonas tetramitiformis TaxID=36881 RepID=A0AAE0BJ56_9CHLO|nr:hypothetical protein CYMTET_53016 [Cymbomonas tetramitiformis]
MAGKDCDPRALFEILEEIGKGSCGVVFKARDKKTSELVAIKILSISDENDGFEEVTKEITMLQECDHPNVVRYLGQYTDATQQTLWIVMEYCIGGNVGDLMKATLKPLSEAQIAYICQETLKGLQYLHCVGKVHRDIKGSNILLTENGNVKVADFGVAAQLTRTMSKRNTFTGTPHWMAPEMIQNDRYNASVDIWALGIVCIEMAEMLPPRWHIHPMRVIFVIPRDPPPSLSEPENWSLSLRHFVQHCLVKDPKYRASGEQLLQTDFITASKAGPSCLVPAVKLAYAKRSSETSGSVEERVQHAAMSPFLHKGPASADESGTWGTWRETTQHNLHDNRINNTQQSFQTMVINPMQRTYSPEKCCPLQDATVGPTLIKRATPFVKQSSRNEDTTMMIEPHASNGTVINTSDENTPENRIIDQAENDPKSVEDNSNADTIESRRARLPSKSYDMLLKGQKSLLQDRDLASPAREIGPQADVEDGTEQSSSAGLKNLAHNYINPNSNIMNKSVVQPAENHHQKENRPMNAQQQQLTNNMGNNSACTASSSLLHGKSISPQVAAATIDDQGHSNLGTKKHHADGGHHHRDNREASSMSMMKKCLLS